jgi:cell division inhibitor SulA
MSPYWLLFAVPFLLYFWARRSLRRQQRRLSERPSRWQDFVTRTRRLRREELREAELPSEAELHSEAEVPGSAVSEAGADELRKRQESGGEEA